MAILVIFWSYFGDRMANLGLIDFKLGLYINVNVNDEQNKFQVHISKLLAKMAINRPDATLLGITWSFFIPLSHSFL